MAESKLAGLAASQDDRLRLVPEADGVVSLYRGPSHLWTYHHTPVASGHPCFHPVNTPQGHTITMLYPWDHFHHCGLWFSWKTVNGVNVWEGPAYEPYESTIVPGDLEAEDGGLTAMYRWERGDGTQLLEGRTTIQCRLLAEDAYALDLAYRFRTPGDTPVVLDRELPPQAGYAGLSARLLREFEDGWYIDADGRAEPAPRGTRTAWHSYGGPIDGWPDQWGGIALMDHPKNPRFPTPTYTVHEREGQWGMNFLQCAFLYHEPYVLEPRRPLDLRYRAVVYDKRVEDSRLAEWFDEFSQDTSR